MRSPQRGAARNRPGKVLVITVLLLPVLLGFAALVTDLGMGFLARSQLQTVADAGALAGAQQLVSDNRLVPGYVPTAEMAAARSQARTIGGLNKVLTASAVVNDADVVITELDWDTVNRKWTAAASPQPSKYNSVRVNAQRSSNHGGLIPALFSSIWGSPGMAVGFTSTATVQNYTITGFQSTSANAQVLPIAMAQNNYNLMLAGQTSDQYTYNEPTTGNPNGTVSNGPDGIYESLIYPVNTQNAGNWGTVKIGVSNNSTQTLGDQIRNGVTPTQLANVPGGLQVGIQLSGNPGISAGIKDDLTSIIGKPVTVPLFDQSSGNGNNTTYTISGFGAVRIVAVNFQGNPKYVIVQPAYITDPTAIAGTPQGSWSAGGVIRLHLSQ
jgi:Flp pilus assembly protein TadG